MVLFNPLDAWFLLSTTHVHNLATCSSHIDSSTGCYTWLRFFISSTHHSQCTSITTWFVVNDNSFTLGLLVIIDWHFVAMNPLCIRSLPDFCWLFAFVFSLDCVYLCPHLPGTFDASVPILDFYLHKFSPQICWYPFLTLGPIQGHKVQHWGRFKRSLSSWAWFLIQKDEIKIGGLSILLQDWIPLRVLFVIKY